MLDHRNHDLLFRRIRRGTPVFQLYYQYSVFSQPSSDQICSGNTTDRVGSIHGMGPFSQALKYVFINCMFRSFQPKNSGTLVSEWSRDFCAWVGAL